MALTRKELKEIARQRRAFYRWFRRAHTRRYVRLVAGTDAALNGQPSWIQELMFKKESR